MKGATACRKAGKYWASSSNRRQNFLTVSGKDIFRPKDYRREKSRTWSREERRPARTKIGSGRMKSAPRPLRWESSWKMVRPEQSGGRHKSFAVMSSEASGLEISLQHLLTSHKLRTINLFSLWVYNVLWFFAILAEKPSRGGIRSGARMLAPIAVAICIAA